MKKLGDWAIALTVVACSVVLLLALAFALQGNPFSRPDRTLRAHFADITGLQQSSLVKYAGAPAGVIHAVRILTPAERAAAKNPADAIEVTIALNRNVPALNEGLVASIAADTLLSDKFLLLAGGDPRSPELANGALVPSVPPVTFDALLRDLGGTLATLRRVFGGLNAGAVDELLPKVDQLLARLDTTVTQAQGLLGNADKLITNADGLVNRGDALVVNADQFLDRTKVPVEKLLTELGNAADLLEALAGRADKILRENEGNLNAAASDAKVALAELKATAIGARALVDSLRSRPQQLIWGPGRERRPANSGN